MSNKQEPPAGTPCRYRVPFRQVYCDTFGSWLKAILWCHVALRLYPNASDPGGPRRQYDNPPTA